MSGRLEVSGLSVNYGRSPALVDVSLTADPGEVVAVIGPNGAGKTTLLKAISGLLAPAGGTISYAGRRIDGRSSHWIVEAGLVHVPEGRRLFPTMSVDENLKMGAYGRRGQASFAKSLADVYDHFPILRGRTKQTAGSMSGGEQQMLAIGRALMARPGVLLLDEPTIGLAPIMVEELARTIADLAATLGCAVVLVEQNVELALGLASRGYVLDLGRVVASDTSSALRTDPKVSAAYLSVD